MLYQHKVNLDSFQMHAPSGTVLAAPEGTEQLQAGLPEQSEGL